MKFVVDTDKSVEQATADLEAAVARHGFGVLHTYDLQTTLRSKGQDLDAECRILEVCNPAQAARVLAADMDMNMALPCRVSVYERDGRTRIGMLAPTALLGTLSDESGLRDVAEEVEAKMRQMIEEAR
jgi:uncharacterized protein (DUF302 family)